ncbi:MAG: PspC domain-containing protein [Coriobacteriales bacterium]|jgi:phage shock protein PspC (stress-responsive transcriptional regulator)|nr:PspC domain-containing protein [Coriobacteriales bacterium]
MSNNNGRITKNGIAIVIGVLLVLFGVWQLAERVLGLWYYEILKHVTLIINIVWPLAMIAGGILLMVNARRGRLSLPTDKKLFRSVRNKKVAGVCGGIAEYLSADPAMVRVFAIILAILCVYVIVPLYLLSWIIIPQDTKNYNTWV